MANYRRSLRFLFKHALTAGFGTKKGLLYRCLDAVKLLHTYFSQVKWFVIAFRFYTRSYMHLALAVCALQWVTAIRYGINPNLTLCFFTFWSVIFVYTTSAKYYNCDYYFFQKMIFFRKKPNLFYLLSGFISLLLLPKLAPKTILYLTPLSLVSLLYIYPVFPLQVNLRTIPGIKIFVVAAIWSGLTVYIPILDANIALSIDIGIEMIQRFLYVLVLLLPFEIRDLAFDNAELKTLPQLLGIKTTKCLGSTLLLAFTCLSLLKSKTTVVIHSTYIAIAILSAIFLWMAKTKQNRYYSSFWVESISVIWLGTQLFIEHV